MPLPKSFIWDVNETNMVEPSNAAISDGFDDGDRPPAGWVNYVLNAATKHSEANRNLYHSRVLNWKSMIERDGDTDQFAAVWDAKLLSNGQEVLIAQDNEGDDFGTTVDDLDILVLNHATFVEPIGMNINTGIKILPVQGSKQYHPWVADDGLKVAVIAPNGTASGDGKSLLHADLPLVVGGSTFTAATIDGETNRHAYAVHYSTVHSLWFCVTRRDAVCRLYTATTANGTWTNRQTLDNNTTGAFIAENADGVLVVQVKTGTNTHEYWRSTNGTTWTSVTDFGIAAVGQHLMYDAHNDLFWSRHQSNLYKSTTGDTGTWTLVSAFEGSNWDIRSMSCDQYGVLVAYGFSISVQSSAGLYWSADAGESWNELIIPTDIAPPSTSPMHVCYSGTRFLAGAFINNAPSDIMNLWCSWAITDMLGVGTEGTGISTASPEYLPAPPASQHWRHIDHMCNSNTSTATGGSPGRPNISSGAVSAVRPAGYGPGVLEFSTTTNTNGQAGWVTTETKYEIGGGVTWAIETTVEFQDLSDGTNTYKYQFGFVINGTIPPATNNACALIEYQHDLNSGKFQCRTRNVSDTTVDSGITVAADTKYTLRIEANSDGTLVTFYINGTSVGTSSAQIPTATDLGIVFNIDKNAGSTARTFWSDYIDIQADF